MTTPLIHRLEETRARVWHQAKSHLDEIEARGEAIDGENLRRWDQLNGELSQLDERLDELRERESRGRKLDELRTEFPARAINDARVDDAELVRSFMLGERRTLEVDLSRVTTSVSNTGAHETRDLMVGTGSGSNTVPTSFRSQLVEHLVQSTGMRQTNATVLTTDAGEELTVPTTTAISTAAIVDEGDAIGESDPTFAIKYGLLLQASRELVEDAGFDLVDYLARETGQAIGLASGAHYVTGNGTTQPQGIAAAASVGKTGSTGVGGAFTGDDLIDLHYSVTPGYRANGFWMMNDATAAAVRKLKDPGGDHYLWEQSFTAGTPSQLLGRPVVIDPNVANIGTTNRSVLFGDFSRYFVRDVKSIRFERSDDYAFGHDLVTWRALLRTDGRLADTTGAIKAFVGGADS